MSFEQKLKETRILKGYTQSQLADLIGVKPSTYCNYEKGRRKPNAIILRNLSIALEISSDELLEMDSVKL